MRGRLPAFPQSRSLAAAAETYVRDGWVHRDERWRLLTDADQGWTR
jgi:hypothetical protein